MAPTLKPGVTLLVQDIAYEVRHVLHRPLPGQEGPAETLLLAHCLSGPHASRPALVRRLDGTVDAPALRRIQDGGRLARRMDHPHITQVWQVHPEPETLSIVSEYIPGFDLETVASYCALLRRPPLTAFVCFIAAATADALDYLHRLQDDLGRPLGVIHRGIGLANIRLGTGGEVKLSGFDGMFSVLEERQQTTTNILRGDLAYASPEYVCHGQKERGLDFFALGLMMLELMMGHHPLDDPYDASLQTPAGVRCEKRLRAEQQPWLPLDVLAQRLLDFSPEQVELAALEQPEPVVAILKRALEQDPGKRYASGAELRDDLHAWLHGLPVPYSPDVAVEEVRHLRDQARAASRQTNPVEWEESKG
jgi:serine/threonine-protein kinase